MNEQEIDALMAGQEDENGSVHYEGTSTRHVLCPLCPHFVCADGYETKTHVSVPPPAFVKHIMSV